MSEISEFRSGCARHSHDTSPAALALLVFFLPPTLARHHVFRAALFSIVLALVAAPEATLLCKVWCPSEAGASDCRHHGGASSVALTTTDPCDAVDPSVVAVTGEDGRRVAPHAGAWHAVPRQPFALVPPHQATHTVEFWARENVLEARRLETILRL